MLPIIPAIRTPLWPGVVRQRHPAKPLFILADVSHARERNVIAADQIAFVVRRLPPDATQKMLTQHLRELECDGVVTRKVYHLVPPKVEYSLTAFGKTLQPLLREMRSWGLAHGARPNKSATAKRKAKAPAIAATPK